MGAQFPRSRTVSLKAAHYLMDEPFQLATTSLGTPPLVYVAPCLEEFEAATIAGVLALEFVQALIELHYFPRPNPHWSPAYAAQHYLAIAQQAIHASICVHHDGLPEYRGLIKLPEWQRRAPWLAPWFRADLPPVDTEGPQSEDIMASRPTREQLAFTFE